MVQWTKNIKDVIIVALMSVIFGMGIYLSQIPTRTIIETETIIKYQCQDGQIVASPNLCPTVEEKGLIHTTLVSWGENLADPDELIFQFYVNNFGYSEARNVEVTCEVYELDEEGYHLYESPDLVAKENVGNIASISSVYKEIYVKPPFFIGENYSSICYPTDCENCEILVQRIPEFNQTYIS